MLFKNHIIILLLLLVLVTLQEINSDGCIKRQYTENSFVCVCNSTYCDSIKPVPDNLDANQYVTYTSTKDQLRMKQDIGNNMDSNNNQDTADITLSRGKTYQKIMGFGGAMTDAAAINIASLPDPARDLLMQQYFGDNGIQYTIVRVPIGGTDYSPRQYSLDDTDNDTDLVNFQLTEEDTKYKIPAIKQAMNLSKTYPIKLMGCAWTGPAYMKTNNNLSGMGSLLPKYYQVYANYLLRFLQEYQKQGLNFYIVSAQNEPFLGGTPVTSFNGMGWDARSQGDFVLNNMGPTFADNGFSDVKIMVGDDQRLLMPAWISEMLTTVPEVGKYVSGIGIHWYTDFIDTPESLKMIHETPGFENKFILYSEASANAIGSKRGIAYGYWDNGEFYMQSMIGNLNEWSEGWVDWNLMLDLNSGPSWINNPVDAAIIVNASAGEFYKNPMYYAMAHVSKFVVPGSVRIDIMNNLDQIFATAFDTPNNQTVLVLLNLYEDPYNITVQDVERNQYKYLQMPPKSFMTVIN